MRKLRDTDLVATPAGRRVVFAALYVSEGAPIGFLWWYLPPKLRLAGVDTGAIATLVGALVLPWALKFLWAPLVDVLRGPRWGHRRWILSLQLLTGMTLLPLAALDLAADFSALCALLAVHAFVAATQDVAIDAWAIGVTPRSEHAGISGWMQAGKYAGRWLFGPGLLLAGGALGLGVVLPALAAAVWASGLLVLLSRDVDGAGGDTADEASAGFGRLLRQALSRPATWLGLAVAALAGAGFEAAGGLAAVFLVDRGLDETAIGWFLSASVALLLSGSLAGGAIADRIGHRRAVALFVVCAALCAGALAAADAAAGGGEAELPVLALLGALYLTAGMLVAAEYGLLMDLTEPRIAGTQFSAFMGATNVCEAWATVTAGRLAATAGLGYPLAFGTLAGLSLLALPLLVWLARLAPPRPAPPAPGDR